MEDPRNDEKQGIYWHECRDDKCTHMVEFDDEPFCFTHSPDSGSSVRGWSAKAAAEKRIKEDTAKADYGG